MSVFKRNKFVRQLLKNNNFSTKIKFYFSNKTAGADFDEYEKNYTVNNLDPHIIKGYVSDLTPEALVWKQYGFKEQGAKEILTDARYADWFRNAARIVIEENDYSVYNEALGNKAIITKRPLNLIKVVLFRK